MRLLDAYALVALIGDEPAADEVEELLRDGDCHVVALNLAEATDICQRQHGIAAGEVRAAIQPLTLSNVLTVSVSDENVAWSAGDLRAKHYHRKDRPVSMADCFLLAHAVSDNGELATSDPDLAGVARAEGVAVIPLPDRRSERP